MSPRPMTAERLEQRLQHAPTRELDSAELELALQCGVLDPVLYTLERKRREGMGQFVSCDSPTCRWVAFTRTRDLPARCRDGCPRCRSTCSSALGRELTRGAK